MVVVHLRECDLLTDTVSRLIQNDKVLQMFAVPEPSQMVAATDSLIENQHRRPAERDA